MNPEWSLLLSHLTLVGVVLLSVLVITRIIRQRRAPGTTMAWLLAVALVPYVGIPLYLIFGGRKLRNLAAGKSGLILPELETVAAAQAAPLDRLLRTYNLPGATCGNRIRLCSSGEDGYARLVELIESARRRISLLTYLLHYDAVGRDILRRLERRAREGVEVRLLLDKIGSLYLTKRFFSPLVKAGGRVAFFLPAVYRSNLRNHRKMLICDDVRVLAGGANIADEYLGPAPDKRRWQDLSFVLSGPAVSRYAEVFRADWQFASGEIIRPLEPPAPEPAADGEEAVLQVVPSGPDVLWDPLYDAILSAAFQARRRIWIVTPYFVPDDALAQSLRLAARRGVEVRILVPERSNHFLADRARGTYLREIQSAGGKIYFYSAGMVHAKLLLVDDRLALLGSPNFDMRSLFLNFEIALFSYSEPFVRRLETWSAPLFTQARLGVRPIGTLGEYFEGLVRLFAPLL